MDNNLKNLIAFLFIALPTIVILMFVMKAYSLDSYDEEAQDKTIELLQSLEKKAIVQNIKHTELKWDKYTIRVGLWGGRKPIPTIRGLTTQERAKEWLISEGSTNVKTSLPIWIELGQKYKIDYTVPLCIAWADSSLGKALKSKNNVGNVNNNDRWDVKHYDTLEAWIEAIYWNLAKWKYMSWHEIIGTLSGEWRKRLWLPWCNEEKDYRKKCYATSLVTHSTNVTNCLSALHNKEIREDYNFRLN